MEAYATEEQQVESIIKFWDNYKKYIILGITVLFLLFSGFKYHKYSKDIKAKEASVIYSDILTDMFGKNYTSVKQKSDKLLTNYKNTAYGDMVYLVLTKVAVEEENIDQAVEYLNRLIKKSPKLAYIDLVKIRLARLLNYKGEHSKALDLINTNLKNLAKKNGSAFAPLYEEAKGDIYFAMGDEIKAKQAYKSAVYKLDHKNNAPWLELKLLDLGEGDK